MTLTQEKRIILAGMIIETVGLFLDILHHLNIGIERPEGLLTPFHFTILLGFLITVVGVVALLFVKIKRR